MSKYMMKVVRIETNKSLQVIKKCRAKWLFVPFVFQLYILYLHCSTVLLDHLQRWHESQLSNYVCLIKLHFIWCYKYQLFVKFHQNAFQLVLEISDICKVCWNCMCFSNELYECSPTTSLSFVMGVIMLSNGLKLK